MMSDRNLSFEELVHYASLHSDPLIRRLADAAGSTFDTRYVPSTDEWRESQRLLNGE